MLNIFIGSVTCLESWTEYQVVIEVALDHHVNKILHFAFQIQCLKRLRRLLPRFGNQREFLEVCHVFRLAYNYKIIA